MNYHANGISNKHGVLSSSIDSVHVCDPEIFYSVLQNLTMVAIKDTNSKKRTGWEGAGAFYKTDAANQNNSCHDHIILYAEFTRNDEGGQPCLDCNSFRHCRICCNFFICSCIKQGQLDYRRIRHK